MRLVLTEPNLFKDSIGIISELVNEARFKITKNGMELIAMDPANVAMVIFKLLSSSFAQYDVKEDTQMAINLTNLKQILKRAKPNDTLTLETTEDNKLKIEMKAGDNKRTFSIPIIEFDEKEQRVPDLDFPVSIKITASMLQDSIDDVGIVAESVSFIAEPDKMTIQAEGDLSKAHIEIPQSSDTIIKAVGKTRAKYSIEYLKKMIAGGKLASHAELFFNQDYPLKVEYKVVDKMMLSFILAPRVEND